jgi:alpha-glucosidase
LRTFTLNGKEKELIIQQHTEGTFETQYSRFKINLKGLPFKVKRIELDNEKITLDQVQLNGDNSVIIGKDFTEIHLFGA